ncbi:MAG TPA: alpha/beta fold hydrolase, partial [Chloroflexota bacterium]|nr:alpha/beta fold hydrolase [Chloroflexota bacterium]
MCLLDAIVAPHARPDLPVFDAVTLGDPLLRSRVAAQLIRSDPLGSATRMADQLAAAARPPYPMQSVSRITAVPRRSPPGEPLSKDAHEPLQPRATAMNQMPRRLLLLLVLCLAPLSPLAAQEHPAYPTPVEGDYLIPNFRFESGEVLPELRLHYRTLGTPERGPDGLVNNAVLIMHGTTGSGQSFLSDAFAGNLFGPGQLLDATKYFIILPDAIGHGKSSRPSEGLRMRFPKYTYDDMVEAQYRLITEHLGINHLRLVMGTSMGGMHTWMWGYRYPEFMDSLLPLASAPVEIAGRNRMLRKMMVDAIVQDPEWRRGEYTEQPRGLTGAIHALLFMVSSPLQWQKQAPTREAAEEFLAERVAAYRRSLDANDMIYAFESSRFYNPAPHLEKIRAPLLAINSADDQVNPPELGILEREIQRVPNGRFVLLPITEETRGHGTHSIPAIWGRYLAELLAQTEPG